ncbi:hypothetical protein K7432_002982 [Basidiobolus ranarum]|uniref:NADH dehydrogenase subunit 6 n=1 Tax=Basidiobolus ranarum TaxID=34480 RepID=A0ABR2X0W2_9FUNG
MRFNKKKSIEITTTKRILIGVLSVELITLLLLLYFDLRHAKSPFPYIPVVANMLSIVICAVNIYASLRYIKRILLLYSLWCVFYVLWIVFCILTSMHVIKIESYNQETSTKPWISDEDAFESIPIQYGLSFAWYLHFLLKTSALTSLLLVYILEIILTIATAILSILVRRAYLIEQRHWDDLDNQTLTRSSTTWSKY